MYGLDLHCSMILEEYLEKKPVFEEMKSHVLEILRDCLNKNNLLVTAIEARVKDEKSLAGKLEIKGAKYNSLSDITDILGARIITFYNDDVDKIAALIEDVFVIDWDNSVDKRKLLQLNAFGYMSLHYICRIPKSLFSDPTHPEFNECRFEIQLRSALQHVWANMDHDAGYKTGFEVPREYLRSMNRLAGLLELADDELSRLRKGFADYRRQIETLVSKGNIKDIPLNKDTFKSFLELKPFNPLLDKIASLNQAEITESSLMPYLKVLLDLGFTTLGDLSALVKNYSDDAYSLARRQLGNTDLDIISSTVALQDLCIVYILEKGGGVPELAHFFDSLGGASEGNLARAERTAQLAKTLSFMNKKK
ncbi:MAG: hypothetical protein IJS02_03745 [Bacteroidales bacterium]|nr:hypothetical protein [Bacteroidales bacterium]